MLIAILKRVQQAPYLAIAMTRLVLQLVSDLQIHQADRSAQYSPMKEMMILVAFRVAKANFNPLHAFQYRSPGCAVLLIPRRDLTPQAVLVRKCQ